MKSKYINNSELGINNIGQKVTIHGFVANKRRFGELTFIDLRDRSGIVQCVFNKDVHINKESVIEVSGQVVARKSVNKDLKSGAIEIIVENYLIFSESHEELPFAIRDDINVNEDLRLKYRFLDLRRNKMQNNIILKSNLMFAVREFMHKNGFIDIETPMLARSTPEGARDFLVPTRNANEFWALPQSPQLFKQLLMVSGFEKYYQFARCFRDEDGRKDRQPEFTQLDIEAAFLNVEDFQKYIEELFKHIFAQLGLNLVTPLARIKYFDALRDYGTDKPDLRFGYKIEDINDFCLGTDFDIIKNSPAKRLLQVDTIITKKDFKQLAEIAQKNKANILFYFVVEKGEITHSNFANKVSQSVYNLIEKRKNKDGSYFIVANTYENCSKALGAVRVELNEMFRYAKPDTYHLSWVTDWPMFEYDEENNSWQAAHHPFTQFDHELDELDSLPLDKVMARSYDLVLNGFELGSGSARIYDSKTQQKMFEMIGMDKEQQQSKFGWFINSFKYGVPPHCGIGLGLDRLVMILTNEKSIRDVIAFPKNAKAQDVFTQAPSSVDKKQLDELFIEVKKD
ncbi:Aspartyl-tRNA synthetase [Mycoplasmopsis bovigenitalium 51080]|uniref:Aspartate--tRNA ligase n=1 Tax=Mycoplasmopsis bovigenitalium 51080 TaxID=1188235 RepID=N9VFR3_9BACT|nr:aspartate--tRNA ligase [Mycoplasmopsis bovigenitalium]ENY70191.1 Aspartyl-tRNA synthetase [Mycoplasmopsis bovigenitalium 51080]